MSGKNVVLILDQVRMRLDVAEIAYDEGDFEKTDKELSELRDVLDDIYDRPEEGIIEPGTLDHR